MGDGMSKIALITGAAGGIGRATVEKFVAEEWTVLAIDRIEAGILSEAVIFHRLDVSNPDDVIQLFDLIRSEFSGLNTLINNAAIQLSMPLIEMEVHEWDAVMASNLRSIYLTARHGYDLLKTTGGSIVNVSSVHALATSKDIAAYAASKGGVVALTRAMALEFAEGGVRVNAILPGAVDTPMLRDGLGRDHVSGGSIEERLAELAGKTVMGRIGEPREIAEAILFLADDDRSSFMTGQILTVDGGATARLSTE
jgi:NAD(P)-dependent dehydrogenase (short-subunit alcohol dehydrogenase family)